MRIGYIGFGEAAYEIAYGLKQEGITNIHAFDPLWKKTKFNDLIQQRIEQADVTMQESPEEVIQKSQLVFVAVPADKAFEVSQEMSAHIYDGLLYVDVSASTPEVKQKISNVVESKGAKFIDASLMGPMPTYRHKVPILASGAGTDDFIHYMAPYNMNIQKVSDREGDASAVKLMRSIFMKGSAVLFIEMLEAAHYYNVDYLVLESISKTMDSQELKDVMNRLVTGTSIHSSRRSVEMQGTIEMLEAAKLNASISKATKAKLDSITDLNLKEQFDGKVPDSWLDVIKVMHQKHKSGAY